MVSENLVKDVVSEPYKYGFVTDIETEKISKGLNEDTIRLISEKKEVVRTQEAYKGILVNKSASKV